jgi:hypothetical protein
MKMPNWCENVMIISGCIEELNEFARYVESDELILDFEEIIPSPAWKWKKTRFGSDCCEDEYDFGEEGKLDWYDWNVRFWGTKWNLDENIRKEFINGDLVYRFDTAWSPPTGIIKELVKVFENLTIRCQFVEPGMGFYGECGGNNGVYYQWGDDMTPESHPEYFTFACDECDNEFIHDGRACPHCGCDEDSGHTKTMKN